MEEHWTETSPGIPPAAGEEESADKVTVVLAAVAVAVVGSANKLQEDPVGAGYVLVAAVDETVTAVAAKVPAEAPVGVLGSWIGSVIQGQPGNLAAVGPDWEDPAAGHRETGQTVELRFENRVAEIVGALGRGLAVAPGIEGACGTADRVVLLGCVAQKLAEGGVALGKVFGRQVVQMGFGNMGFAADLDEDLDLVGHNMVTGLESHSLLVPVVHKIPSVDHTASHPFLQGSVLASPLGISGDPVVHNPGLGNQVPVVGLLVALAVFAVHMGCLLHRADLSFFPLDQWDQVAGS